MESVKDLANKIIEAYNNQSNSRVFTVAISGIDASGKGFISSLLQKELAGCGLHTANINIDPWQHPIPTRLKKENAAENVYENIFRWNDFFEQLIFPLQKNRSVYLETKGIRSDADIYYPLTYSFKIIDILIIEGILLFKTKYLPIYDLTIWIDCSFESGLKRAIKRNVEKLDEERLVLDYDMYYYAAQRLHFDRDKPRDKADLIFDNSLQIELA